VIRERTDEDLVACAAALRSVHETDRYPHSWPHDPIDWLCPPRQRRAWVAVSRDAGEPGTGGAGEPGTGGAGEGGVEGGVEIAGHVAVNIARGDPALEVSTRGAGLPATGLIVVSRLFVVSTFRRRGTARALLNQAVAHAHSEKLRPVLDVLEADSAAVAFYDQIGWQRIGTIVFRSREGEPLPALVYAGPAAPASPGW